MKEKLGDKFLKGTEIVNFEQLAKNKLIGLYFCAYWCPPCKFIDDNMHRR